MITHLNVIGNIYHELKVPLLKILNQSLSTEIFPDKTEISKIPLILKNDEKNLLHQVKDQYLNFHICKSFRTHYV